MNDLYLNPGIKTKEEAHDYLDTWGCPFGSLCTCPEIPCDICLQKFFGGDQEEEIK